MRTFHRERHRMQRIGWLRAAVLGANDGIVSTASLGARGGSRACDSQRRSDRGGRPGLVAGAMSMAAGEYVSVSSQADTERADVALERKGLSANKECEMEELAGIYVDRGIDPSLAKEVARQLMARDAIGAHTRDELGISAILTARPIQAALTSAGAVAVGAAMPLLTAVVVPATSLIPFVAGVSLLFLALLGGLAAHAGGASVTKGALRVTFWGALAMAVTAGVGALVGRLA